MMELAYNTAKNAFTGMSPFDLLYVQPQNVVERLMGISNRDPTDNLQAHDFVENARNRLKDAREAVTKSLRLQKLYYDRRHGPIRPIQVGDFVSIRLADHPVSLVKRTKLTQQKLPPYKVLEVLGSVWTPAWTTIRGPRSWLQREHDFADSVTVWLRHNVVPRPMIPAGPDDSKKVESTSAPTTIQPPPQAPATTSTRNHNHARFFRRTRAMWSRVVEQAVIAAVVAGGSIMTVVARCLARGQMTFAQPLFHLIDHSFSAPQFPRPRASKQTLTTM
jgi:hypothetical protein